MPLAGQSQGCRGVWVTDVAAAGFYSFVHSLVPSASITFQPGLREAVIGVLMAVGSLGRKDSAGSHGLPAKPDCGAMTGADLAARWAPMNCCGSRRCQSSLAPSVHPLIPLPPAGSPHHSLPPTSPALSLPLSFAPFHSLLPFTLHLCHPLSPLPLLPPPSPQTSPPSRSEGLARRRCGACGQGQAQVPLRPGNCEGVWGRGGQLV